MGKDGAKCSLYILPFSSHLSISLAKAQADLFGSAQDMGGEMAPLEPKQSIAGMLTTLESAEAGSFMGWDGKVLPW